MKHRIRAAALITQGDSILLVQHVHPQTGFECWVPPGGGVEVEDSSVFDCARREVFEESGLQVELGRVVYIREFIDQENQTRHLELFISSHSFAGDITICHIQGCGPDEHFIKDVRWVPRSELHNMVVYPEVLRDVFWDDVANEFPETRYLGTQIG